MKRFVINFFLAILIFFPIFPALAQSGDKIMLSITPPLIRNNVNPGQIWRSTIKLVNNNPEEIDIYVELTDFTGGKDGGTVKFLPRITEDKENVRLSSWIEVNNGPIPIPAYGSIDIPFTVRVPDNAEPGGHYTAILAGTRPGNSQAEGSSLRVSSLLASLLLLTVKGDVIEKGRIREFSTDKKIYSKSQVDLKLRFENIGNVHIQPQGEIKIFNFFNKERGKLILNHNTEFGNVLPQSIRNWNFTWQGEDNLLDMGRYRAELIIGYGNEARETIDQTVYFWVIYFKPFLAILAVVAILAFFIVVSIRAYIRRAVRRMQETVEIAVPQVSGKRKVRVESEMERSIDLNKKIKRVKPAQAQKKEVINYQWSSLKWFAGAVVIILIAVVGILLFVNFERNDNTYFEKEDIPLAAPVSESEESAEAVEEKIGTSSPEIEVISETKETAEEKKAGTSTGESEFEKTKENLIIKILNGSGVTGVAGQVEQLLVDDGYLNITSGNADNYDYVKTLIRHQDEFEQIAESIATLITGAVELKKVDVLNSDIVIIIGKDFK